jgi:ankyrin repeat protein
LQICVFADIVKYLLENGADVMSKTSGMETPLHPAAANGHVEIARHLISNGADPTAPDKDEWTPLHNAAYHGHLGINQT